MPDEVVEPERADLLKLVEKWKSELADKHKIAPDRFIVLFATPRESKEIPWKPGSFRRVRSFLTGRRTGGGDSRRCEAWRTTRQETPKVSPQEEQPTQTSPYESPCHPAAPACCASLFQLSQTARDGQRWPRRCSISSRALMPISFKRAAPFPMTIFFCEPLSTTIAQ